jgi:membrane-bound serine protease (ClpP class)
MSVRTEVLAVLEDPTAAFVVFVIGCFFIVAECLRPGRAWPGITGAVFVTVSLDALTRWPWTWYGVVLLSTSLSLIIFSAPGRSNVGPVISALLAVTGSILLVRAGTGIHPAAAVAGGALSFSTAWLLRLAYGAHKAKRDVTK